MITQFLCHSIFVATVSFASESRPTFTSLINATVFPHVQRIRLIHMGRGQGDRPCASLVRTVGYESPAVMALPGDSTLAPTFLRNLLGELRPTALAQISIGFGSQAQLRLTVSGRDGGPAAFRDIDSQEQVKVSLRGGFIPNGDDRDHGPRLLVVMTRHTTIWIDIETATIQRLDLAHVGLQEHIVITDPMPTKNETLTLDQQPIFLQALRDQSIGNAEFLVRQIK